MAKEEKIYTYQDFLDIIAMLRSENGCPWDREQTHESLKPCMTEEAAELLAAIRIYNKTGNVENMREELGDILLQVVMHAQIASEEGLFTMADVVNEVSRKMVRRHPHVFGTATVDTSDQVLSNWEDIKKEEKKDKSWISSPLQEIPKELPALARAPKVLKKIDKLYGQGNRYEQDLEILEGSLAYLKAHDPSDISNLDTFLTDMLLSLSDIARLYKIPLEQLLSDRIDDIIEEAENRN